MATALRVSTSTSSSAPSLTQRRRRGAATVAVSSRTPRRPVFRALAAASTVATPTPERHRPLALPPTPTSVADAMSRVRAKGKTAFIPYITAGDPDLATTADALRLLDGLGADVIELGMPFSDPSADGAVIQASAKRALAAGATTNAVMAMLKEVTPELSCPVVIFSYFNPIVRRGTASFATAAKEAGVKGLIIPDLPYDEIRAFRKEAINNSLELILLTTPVTPADRMKEITKASEGFVYLVSVFGVTGARATVNPRVEDLLKEIRQVTDKAVAVGFGISTPEHVSKSKH
ncbi:indole-3-glycerol phosphate lyase, chloroplastic-like isoform X2 [Lolium perenne]|uniref:indole-3-glycerol phosphate lyase, chloroplastic-like isoform X2 n=1 Tax=Lolium perenne TaxID=4522 RepID=UPI003A98EE22